MKAMTGASRGSFVTIWGWPLVLASSSVFGLFAALLGQGGFWWPLSWAALTAPLVAIAYCVYRRPV
jgi:hypothetical protein